MPENNTRQIYLDFNASTPVDPAVAEVMQRYLQDAFGLNRSEAKQAFMYWADHFEKNVDNVK